jgi:hypothetical protein
MTPMRLASIFTVLDTYGVQDIIRVQSSVNPLDPPNHSTAVWLSPADWLSVYDSIFYATDEVPAVQASPAATGIDVTVAVDGDGCRLFAWWPMKDVQAIAERLVASGIDQKKVDAWAVIGGAV